MDPLHRERIALKRSGSAQDTGYHLPKRLYHVELDDPCGVWCWTHLYQTTAEEPRALVIPLGEQRERLEDCLCLCKGSR